MDNLDILCINCENLINTHKLLPHSSICITPTPQILKLSSLSDLKNINFRLDKLKCSIDVILYDHTQPLTTDEKMLFTYLSRHISEALSLTDPFSWSRCQEISQKIIEYPQANISPCVTIYLERVRILVQSKAQVFKQEVKAHEANLTLTQTAPQRASVIEGLAFELGRFKITDFESKNEGIEAGTGLEDCKSKRSLESSALSPRDWALAADFYDLDQIMAENEEKMSRRLNEDLQKYFYSKCLVAKLGFSSRDPAQFVQIPELYRKVREMAVPVDKWDEFIREQFKKPEVWLGSKVM